MSSRPLAYQVSGCPDVALSRSLLLIQLSYSSNKRQSFRCVADNELALDVYCHFQIIARASRDGKGSNLRIQVWKGEG